MSEPDVIDAPPADQPITTTIAEYDELTSNIAVLRTRLGKRAYDLTSVKGNKEARQDRSALVSLRNRLDDYRKELNEADHARIKARNAEAKRLIAIVEDLETPIDEQIKADERRRADLKAAEEAKETERIGAIQKRIDMMRSFPVSAVNRSAQEIGEMLIALENLVIDDSFAEFSTPALHVREAAIASLRELEARAIDSEAKAKKLAQQEAELDAMRAAEAKRQAEAESARAAEQARIAEENRRRQAELDADRAAFEKRNQEAKEEQARLDEAAAARRRREDEEAQERRLAADREAEAERAEARRIVEAAAAERRRQEEAVIEEARQRAAQERAEQDRMQTRMQERAAAMLNLLRRICEIKNIPANFRTEAMAIIQHVDSE